MASKKIPNDKYYTPRSLAFYVVAKTNEIIGRSNITEYLEPSGGAGVFLEKSLQELLFRHFLLYARGEIQNHPISMTIREVHCIVITMQT